MSHMKLPTDKVERLLRRALAHSDAGEEEVFVGHTTLAALCHEILDYRGKDPALLAPPNAPLAMGSGEFKQEIDTGRNTSFSSPTVAE